jgi:internalin A
LRLHGLNLSDKIMAQIGEFKELEVLNISGCTFSSAGLKSLVSLPIMKLVMSQSSAGDQTLVQVARLRNLRELDLQRTNVSGLGIEHLGRLSHLSVLNIDYTRVDDQGVRAIANLKSLRTLYLAGNPYISDSGLRCLCKLPALVVLDLSRTGISDAGLVDLAKCRQLSELRLAGDQITDEGAIVLAKMGQLESLDLTQTHISDVGVKRFKVLHLLRVLRMRNCTGVSPRAVQALQEQLPRCAIQSH